MSVQPSPTAFTIDRMPSDVPTSLGYGHLLRHAAQASGRSVIEITKEFRSLEKGPGKLTLAEYVRYGLHHADRFDDEGRAAFIHGNLHWPVAHACNDRKWFGAAEDKILTEMILHAGGIPVPRTLGVFDTTSRRYPGQKALRTPDDLREVILANATDGVFCKPVAGIISAGAFRVEQALRDTIRPTGADPMDWDGFATNYLGGHAYLVQTQLENDGSILPWTSALATVRTSTIMMPDRTLSPFALLKIPQGKNVADNFWRAGNLACGLDVDSGRVQRIVRDGSPELDLLPDHPDIPGLMGLKMPHWDALRDIVAEVARLFAPLRYHSTDIALTPDGPVVVEVNYGGSMELVQTGCGKGFLTPEVRELFESCNAVSGKPKSRRFGFLRRR
ncbi:hypothetical protein MWU52_05680 [Jannaschia sp. S6380]|uniref:sugar-transfer associated ATP-grasp domain-containing protein n=1 Tax=Jannaschia sp. S6380 TaxID=2926408 RepID=UPI001FF66FD6|nr:sugar-transfer associated ATP-grasp domain-containing protein [Jannaschia sp. S6380]MCK0167033.1 hypothetical protein [Jannaschia sp. S6380]